ncbi:M23 family metallopeptidase [Pseudoalteromonas denitrificans]|uniref:Murein DD-endopeptidase MepM and murein hydrolase activator NlpD, contain LysM domain n=1 Tax=Pseudoalteromonas denitrificans DSM 6059 TaxID=1123010 RepID=A0A1I1G064_9GAMM|nr:M23 family metallopeptidase [Pseudoalteromonas denitrificans]SFC04911.1 Murein DD-endopeptidase MepM and murein hydrolase activator NlpD, contain LysM domain [Pseudoalteromonas denitrificans DSM 6059]
MHKVVSVIYLLLSAWSVNALELKGHLIQGGMVTGKLPDAKLVKLDDAKIKLSKQGEFVFGFGRDAKLNYLLTWVDKSGKSFNKSFLITKRDYKIDKITGVAKKYVSPPKSVLNRIKSEAKAVRKARSILSNRIDFLQPVYRPAKGRISGVYGSQRYFNGTPKRPHFGLDIANKKGTQVYSPLPGKVVFADPDLYYSGGTLIIDHGHGITSTYIHLSQVTAKLGQEIKTGDKIAKIGATGRVTGPHLDWRLNWKQVRLDPALVMQSLSASKFSN